MSRHQNPSLSSAFFVWGFSHGAAHPSGTPSGLGIPAWQISHHRRIKRVRIRLEWDIGDSRGFQQCHRVSGWEFTARAWGTKPLSLSGVSLYPPPQLLSFRRVLSLWGGVLQQVCRKTAFRRECHCCKHDPVRRVVCVIWGERLTSTIGKWAGLSASRRAFRGAGFSVGVAVPRLFPLPRLLECGGCNTVLLKVVSRRGSQVTTTGLLGFQPGRSAVVQPANCHSTY